MRMMLTWLALIIAIIALILGWTAFNRSGENVEVIIEQRIQEAADRLRLEFQRENEVEVEEEEVEED